MASEKRLIELLETVVSPKEILCYGEVLVSTSRVADHLIANDVVPVVRCKDCKHYMTIQCTCDGCCISDDWYCADGERKDNVQ